MHNKLAVIDDAVITGSFNFSNNATKNAENILLIEDKAIADRYAAYVAALTEKYPEKGL
jgi:phosphatidylserine/phosphatidylglycerophosphate/cardiolipin synthase-like enzyme